MRERDVLMVEKIRGRIEGKEGGKSIMKKERFEEDPGGTRKGGGGRATETEQSSTERVQGSQSRARSFRSAYSVQRKGREKGV